ncbi:general transcription factor IIF subunit 1 isoform X1 [Hydra vulgaris]|uniref:Transcription initiation factor IIF subunit alpha n=1 Tax=Hydra vulgaris TaxID=6087 RepID=A0ABM4C6H5_HYDVU
MASYLPSSIPAKQEQYSEYKLRVPRKLVKKYNVMKINSPKPLKIESIKEANMVRKTKKQLYVEDETSNIPAFGAGSVYNYDRKEEARRKRRGYIMKEINKDDLPYALRLGGKGGKRFTGRKEPIEHSAYYILTQCPDGVFEAVPVQAWYNFMPDINYSTLTADEVEHEFSKRDRTLSYFTNKYKLGTSTEEEETGKKKNKEDDGGLIIHDNLEDADTDDYPDANFGSDEEDNEKKALVPVKKNKSAFASKPKKSDDDGSDEEEETENFESKEVDYMSESSSDNEVLDIEDEPDPNKEDAAKPKDDLNIFSDSSDDDAEDKDLNEAGKELKAILKKEIGGESSEEEVDDEDIDDEYSKSAIFMQGGKKKKSSNSNSVQGSRSSTPIQNELASDTLNQAVKSLKEGKAGSKRAHEASLSSSQSKKPKIKPSGSFTVNDNKKSDIKAWGTNSPSSDCITEETIRRYLMHKPMTTTDLMRKFKTKKTCLSKEQTVTAIAAILKKIQLHQEKIDGKLFLSIKPRK